MKGNAGSTRGSSLNGGPNSYTGPGPSAIVITGPLNPVPEIYNGMG